MAAILIDVIPRRLGTAARTPGDAAPSPAWRVLQGALAGLGLAGVTCAVAFFAEDAPLAMRFAAALDAAPWGAIVGAILGALLGGGERSSAKAIAACLRIGTASALLAAAAWWPATWLLHTRGLPTGWIDAAAISWTVLGCVAGSVAAGRRG